MKQWPPMWRTMIAFLNLCAWIGTYRAEVVVPQAAAFVVGGVEALVLMIVVMLMEWKVKP